MSASQAYHTNRYKNMELKLLKLTANIYLKYYHISSYYLGYIFIIVYNVLILLVNVIYVFLLLLLCILIGYLCITTLTEVFPCFFLSCKANTRVKSRKDGARPAIFLIFVLFYVLFVLFHSMYCLCVYVYCTTATGWLPSSS
jgi:dolichol kinase